jgi:antitoxin VapB
MEVEMGMNIKSERAHVLAKRLSKETGDSITSVVEKALEEKLLKLERSREKAGRLLLIRNIVAKLGPVPPGVTSDHSDLYDEWGLPH